jgi:hypothetical protein
MTTDDLSHIEPGIRYSDVLISDLKPHPQNYQEHPDDQLGHIRASLAENGCYRNIVISSDGYILAGHGVVDALRSMGKTSVKAVKMPFSHDNPRAIKLLIGDNEISHLSKRDDRLLTNLLKILHSGGDSLSGTGYDSQMLAALAYVTRPASELRDFDEASHWVGLPEYQEVGDLPDSTPIKLVVSFRCQADKDEFAKRLGITLHPKANYTWYPPRQNEDLSSLKFSG